MTRTLLVLIASLGLLGAAPAPRTLQNGNPAPLQQPAPLPQNLVNRKLGFLYAFADLATWPGGRLPKGRTVKIGILGGDPWGKKNREAFAKSAQDKNLRPVKFVVAQNAGQLNGCHIVYVNGAKQAQAAQIQAALAGKPILLVADWPNFAAKGGAMNFKLLGGRIRWDINLKALKDTSIKPHIKLRDYADVVHE